MRVGDWDDVAKRLSEAARRVEAAGADFLLLCTNTMHRVAPQVESAVGIPLLHIVDPTARELRRQGLRRVGLLGTRFTMEEAFYRERLSSVHGIEALTPPAAERERVHRVIFEELCLGTVLEDSRQAYLRVVGGLVERGAQGVILGCTEIGMLLPEGDLPVPGFDTTVLHAREAARLALEGEG